MLFPCYFLLIFQRCLVPPLQLSPLAYFFPLSKHNNTHPPSPSFTNVSKSFAFHFLLSRLKLQFLSRLTNSFLSLTAFSNSSSFPLSCNASLKWSQQTKIPIFVALSPDLTSPAREQKMSRVYIFVKFLIY
jgi:hypothetical protein